MSFSKILPAGLATFAASWAMSATIDVVAFQDAFDTKTAGAPINGQTPDVGQTWYGDANTPVSNAQARSASNSLVQVRTGGGFSAMGLSDAVAGMAQPNRTYTLKMDVYTPGNSDAFSITVRNNSDFNKQHTIFALGDWMYYNPATSSYVDTGVAHAGGQWNSVELEIRNGAETSPGVYNATIEFFLTQPAGGTRTSVVTWSQSNLSAQNVYGVELGPYYNSTVYYDNIQFGYSLVPEPSALGLIGLAALGACRRTRRQ